MIDNEINVSYICVKCNQPVTTADISFRGDQIKCPNCGYRVLTKIRPPIVKRVKAI